MTYQNKIQTHLNTTNTINLGSFYTPRFLVNLAYTLMNKYCGDLNNFTLLDSSCGYGDFFIKDLKYIGADIDEVALSKVKNVKTIHTNSLQNVTREKFHIKEKDPLIIIGNPPYNDTTSIIRQSIKKKFDCDEKLKYRDLGICFMRSYAVLLPEFICILHPLSYLIKQANFNALNNFKNKYNLLDGIIVSSEFFTPNSNTFFPIIIALYKKNNFGMDYEFIKNYNFITLENQSFKLNNFDKIDRYITKYPNHNDSKNAIAFFHTLRDINALKRNQSFMSKQTSNAIKVFDTNLKYYVYVHFFKLYCGILPYYFGNLDIFINHNKFNDIQDELIKWFYKLPYDKSKIDRYFKELFKPFVKEHI